MQHALDPECHLCAACATSHTALRAERSTAVRRREERSWGAPSEHLEVTNYGAPCKAWCMHGNLSTQGSQGLRVRELLGCHDICTQDIALASPDEEQFQISCKFACVGAGFVEI